MNGIFENCDQEVSVSVSGQSTLEVQHNPHLYIEISIKGKWVAVPAVDINGNIFVITGSWLRMAELYDEEWLEKELADPEFCARTLKGLSEPRADMFSFTQKFPDVAPRYPYYFEPMSLAVLDVEDFKRWWEALPQETRKNVRRSEKRGVVVRVQKFDDEVVRGIADVQNESPIRQGRKYPHYGKTLDQVRRDHSSFADRSDFICAYSGDEFIGFLKLVYRGELASILQLNSKIAHYDKRPSNALLAKAVELSSAKRVSHVTYGRFNYGNKNDSSLRDFKIRNGFRDCSVPRYYVPLTMWGQFCLRVKLYRPLMDILPRGVINTFTRTRAKLYAHRASMSRCSSMSERPNCDRQMGRSNPPAGSNLSKARKSL